MNREIYLRLIRIALISSPLLAIYGMVHFYATYKALPAFILVRGLTVMVIMLVTWATNIAIIRYIGTEKKWKWYLLSYAFTACLHLLLFFLIQILPAPVIVAKSKWVVKNDIFLVYPFILAPAINTIILIICNSIVASEKRKTAEIEIQELKVSNLEAQKRVLLQQLQPHFLFNTLSVLKSLIQENPDEAENYAIKLSEFLRYSVQVHKNDLVSVAEELKFTNDYIDLQKVRFENSVIFEVNIPQELYAMQLPAYALQTLVENAIKHNAFTEKKPLHIRIDHTKDGAILVSNNKMPVKVAETMGTGLKNLNQRYRIIANKDIEVSNASDAFSVKVYLLNNNQL